MKRTILASIFSVGLLSLASVTSVFAAAPVATQQNLFEVNTSESKLLPLKSSIKRAMIANPDVAELKVVSKTELMLTGKQMGTTELFINYRNNPSKAVKYQVKVSQNPQKKLQIEATLKSLLAKLNPSGSVQYEVRTIWVDATSSIRRQIDAVGNQIDGDSELNNKARQDADILQSQQSVGSSSVSATAGNYLVLLSGGVPNNAQKKRIQSVVSALGFSVLNMIKVQGPQEVKLEVRVAEVVKGNPFHSGAIFGYQAAKGSDLLQFVSSAIGAATGTGTFAAGIPNSTEAFQVGVQSGNGNFAGILTAMEENQLARVLARPELIVQSGETAEFLVGGEVPVPVSQNTDAITVDYKEYGVRLRFSPVITESGEIQMTVAPEISDIDFSVASSNGIPGLRSRRAKTTVKLQPGQSFVIGGLIQNSISSNVSKVPLLGDIPILGALFRSTSFEKDQTELAIVVTPTFVSPIDKEKEIHLPGERIVAPSYRDVYWFGKVSELLPEGETAIPAMSTKIGLEKP